MLHIGTLAGHCRPPGADLQEPCLRKDQMALGKKMLGLMSIPGTLALRLSQSKWCPVLTCSATKERDAVGVVEKDCDLLDY